ncbi:tetratricopeptide repeat protein [Candidatus Chlorohelix sp.]|uniref:tetratricopeptide repeat protein n=1 Tax=Candidatus Chlorohelix sp. TaxID=3139201 RepID=UPI003033E42C
MKWEDILAPVIGGTLFTSFFGYMALNEMRYEHSEIEQKRDRIIFITVYGLALLFLVISIFRRLQDKNQPIDIEFIYGWFMLLVVANFFVSWFVALFVNWIFEEIEWNKWRGVLKITVIAGIIAAIIAGLIWRNTIKEQETLAACSNLASTVNTTPREVTSTVPQTSPPSKSSTATENIKYREAIDGANKAIQLNSRDLKSYLILGSSYVNLKDYDKAIENSNEALKIDPNSAYAYLTLEYAYRGKKEYDKALENVNKAIELEPNYPEAFQQRGVLYELYLDNLDNIEKAIEDYNWAIELDADYARAYISRGNVCMLKNTNYAQALTDLNKAIELDPSFSSAYWFRGFFWEHSGNNKDLAIADYRRAVELGYESAQEDLNRLGAK